MGSSQKRSNFLKNLLVNFRLTNVINPHQTMKTMKIDHSSQSKFTSKFFKKLFLFWLKPITSNIKLTMTSHCYKEFIIKINPRNVAVKVCDRQNPMTEK